jgi:hypothetical protein
MLQEWQSQGRAFRLFAQQKTAEGRAKSLCPGSLRFFATQIGFAILIPLKITQKQLLTK